jgi:hypothetical protein
VNQFKAGSEPVPLTPRNRLLSFVGHNTHQNSKPEGEIRMGANHAGERKRRKLKNTKKIMRTQMKKAKSKTG